MTGFNMVSQLWKQLTGSEPSSPEPPMPPAASPTPISFTDQHVARLAAVRRELTTTRARLVAAEARWRTLKARGDDPEVEQACADLRPTLLDLRQQVQTLAAEEAATEQAVTATAALAVQYAALVEETTARFQPLFEAVARLTPAVIADSYRASHELDRRAYELLQQSGDRTFRRAACDPYMALREKLEACLKQVDRQRLLRSVGTSATTKTGTEA